MAYALPSVRSLSPGLEDARSLTLVSAMRPVFRRILRNILPKGHPSRHGYLYALRMYATEKTSESTDLLQGAFGSPEIKDPAVLRRLVSLDELHHSGAEHWTVEEGYTMSDVRSSVFPPSASGSIPKLRDAPARPIVVTRLHDVLVADRDGWLRTAEGRWISDLYPAPSALLLKALPRVEAEAEKPARSLGGTAVLLANENTGNYYHWLHQTIPQIDAIRRALPETSVDRWLVRDKNLPFVRATFEAMGIDPCQIEETTGTPLRCETLLVSTLPSMGALDHGEGWPRRLLRDLFLPREAIRPWRRVYLRRGSRDSRVIVNLPEVDETLRQLGFEVHEMEGRSISDQARLLAETAFLVAPHGAAMANMVFCAPGTKVVEMLPNHWPSPLYGMISSASGFSHAFIPGCEPSIPALNVRDARCGMEVPVRSLVAAIQVLETAPPLNLFTPLQP